MDDLLLELGYRLVASCEPDEAQTNLARLAAWTNAQQEELVCDRVSRRRREEGQPLLVTVR